MDRTNVCACSCSHLLVRWLQLHSLLWSHTRCNLPKPPAAMCLLQQHLLVHLLHSLLWSHMRCNLPKPPCYNVKAHISGHSFPSLMSEARHPSQTAWETSGKLLQQLQVTGNSSADEAQSDTPQYQLLHAGKWHPDVINSTMVYSALVSCSQQTFQCHHTFLQ